MDVVPVMQWLVDNYGLRLPHGMMPEKPIGTGGGTTIFTQQQWEAHEWNGRFVLLESLGGRTQYGPDPEASPKPSWNDLLSVETVLQTAALRERRIAQANDECRRRIALAYHPLAADRPEKEWEVRLSGRATDEMDRERGRLVGVCHALELYYERAEDMEAINGVDPTAEATWAPALPPPAPEDPEPPVDDPRRA